VNFIQTIRVFSISSRNQTLTLGKEESWSLLRIMMLEINYRPREANVVVDAWSRGYSMSWLEVEIIDCSSCASSSTSSTLGLLLI
jgi:hypothetical protein